MTINNRDTAVEFSTDISNNQFEFYMEVNGCCDVESGYACLTDEECRQLVKELNDHISTKDPLNNVRTIENFLDTMEGMIPSHDGSSQYELEIAREALEAIKRGEL